MVKCGFTERWHDRDNAYRRLPDIILEKLYAVIPSLAEEHRPKRKMGRPLKVDLAKAAFLAAIKEHHREMPYRELAVSKYIEWLGIKGAHYTTCMDNLLIYPEFVTEPRTKSFIKITDQKAKINYLEMVK